MNRFALLAAAGLMSLTLVACGNKDAAEPMSAAKVAQQTSDPASAVEAMAAKLKDNDLLGAVQLVMPAAQVDELRAKWSENMAGDPPSADDKAQFATTMAMLTADGAESTLLAMLEPQLVKYETEFAAQLPMMVGMGQGFMMQAVQANEDLSEAQKQQTVDMINALGGWLQGAKFADRDLAKKGIGIAVATARKLDLKTLDDVRALDFDHGMAKAGVVFGGVKDILAVYGFDMNQSFSSLKANVISREGSNAKVGFSYNFLGKSLSGEAEMVEQDGRWYGKDTMEQIAKGLPFGDEADDN